MNQTAATPEQALASMWAKTGEGGAWHRLMFHLLDVAACTKLLLERHVPISVRARFAARLGISREQFEAFCIFLAALHDFGKATPPFQVKSPERAGKLAALGLPFPRRPAGTPHGHITASEELQRRLRALGWSANLAQQASRWVGGHHGVFPSDRRCIDAGDHVGSGLWTKARDTLFQELFDLLAPPRAPTLADTAADLGLFVAGLTSVADWIGSMSEHFDFDTSARGAAEYYERALANADRALARTGWRRWEPGAPRTFDELFGVAPRPLQSAIAQLVSKTQEQFFAIVEAPMGEGKTEAAFWVAHELGRIADHRGSYFALPTMATANQMFSRTQRFLEQSYEGRLPLQLLHGGAAFSADFERLRSVVDEQEQARNRSENCGTVVAEEWFSKRKRGLLAPFAVGTIDQALLGVMRTRHGFVRLFGLSGKTVVLDEVHAYDAYTSRLLDRLVAWLRQLGASVVILSATLPRARREALCGQWAAGGPPSVPYPRITAFADEEPLTAALPQGASRTVVVEHLPDDLTGAVEWLVARIERGGCAGLIVNTVARAQDALRMVKRRWPELATVLLHARFFRAQRQEREERVLTALGKSGPRPQRMLVIGTQVLEQSLDIDFDVLATDHAPVDLVLQRTGRLHRHVRSRLEHLSAPVLGIVTPEDATVATGPKFGVHGRIYEEAVLLRSWLAIRDKRTLTIPDEIEPLIELAYAPDPPRCDDALRERQLRLDREFADEVGGIERNAEERLLAAPRLCVDDPFANFELPLDEEDPEVAKQLQALTRLGEPSVQLACLTDATLVERAPNPEETRAIVERTLSFSNRAIVFSDSLLRPASWEDSPWLRNTRALVFKDGQARIGNKLLIDDPELGVVITNATEEDT